MTARFFKTVSSSAIVCCTGAILVIGAAAPSRTQFSIWFQGKTLRLDFYHTGTRAEETLSLGHIREEGPWPGSRASLLDGSGLGDYMIVVSDAKSHQALYSHGFDSSFEPQQTATTEIDSVRIPLPRKPVAVIIRTRRPTTGEFHDIWNGVVDPANHSIDRRALEPRTETRVLVENGSPESKVDIVIIGDGYTEAESNKYWADSERAYGYLFSASPFVENTSSFNVRAVFLPSQESGISSPLEGIWKRSVLGVEYNSHGVERELMVPNSATLRDAVATVPYDVIVVIANSKRYGGVGTYNRLAAAAIDSAWSRYLVVHEFGHTFAGLGDEYYTLAKCTASTKREPWYPNVTSSRTRATLKWRDLVSSDVPVPTPWRKKKYEAFDSDFAKQYFRLREQRAPEASVDALVSHALSRETAMLEGERFQGRVGAFEGADSEACGLFRFLRPTARCSP